MKNAIAVIELAATLGLLVVTYLATRATRQMANTARDAAADSLRAVEAAERTAQAALDAARVAQSQVNVELTGSLQALWDNNRHTAAIEIQSSGDPVVIQAVRVRRAFREHGNDGQHSEPRLANVALISAGEVKMPVRLHPRERLHVTHPVMQEENDYPLVRYLLDIDYTFTENGGAGGTRQLIVDPTEKSR